MPYRIAILVLLLISLPYFTAWAAAGPEHTFGGFLLNPGDGNSYLAKMYEGWRGDWRFSLPFTADPGHGAYLFTFYLGLGHLARLTGLSLILTFHLARLLAALVLLWALWRFLQSLLPQSRHIRLVYALTCLGLGMGWLAFPTGAVTSDFWVAEAYPFLSAYANPHFALSLAILVWFFTFPTAPGDEAQLPRHNTWAWAVAAILASAVLGSISAFGLVLGLAIMGLLLVLRALGCWRTARSSSPGVAGLVSALRTDASFGQILTRLVCMLVGGAPVVLYSFWAIRLDPILAAWDAQNLTPTPPLWDLLLAFSPALILAILGFTQVFRRNDTQVQVVVVWAVLALVMINLPFSLQRRFLIGLAIPLCALAGFGLDWLEQRAGKRFRIIATGAVALTLPTLLLVLMAGQFGALSHEPLLYLARGEAQALTWIETNTTQQAVVLAAPEMGMFIPGHTGRRVIYGHPFETVNADSEKEVVTAFFKHAAQQPVAARNFLETRKVDYVFYGPREQQLGVWADLPSPV